MVYGMFFLGLKNLKKELKTYKLSPNNLGFSSPALRVLLVKFICVSS